MKSFVVVTSAVIINKVNGKVLLAQRSITEDVFPGLWAFPGGKVDESASLSDTLEENVRREIREEIGVEVCFLDFLESHYDGKNKLYVIFLCELASGEPRPLDETQSVSWLLISEALELPLCPHVDFLLKLTEQRLSSISKDKEGFS